MITFTSQASQQCSMQSALAVVLLGILGKTLDARGVITPEEMPDAIARLQRAIQDAAHPAHIQIVNLQAEEDRNDEPAENEPLRLGQRAWPLLHMLEAAQRAHTPILWGV